MREIKFRLRVNNKIVGYEKWYGGCFSEAEGQTAQPCWLYSKDGKRWYTKYIYHNDKDLYTNLKDKNNVEIYEGDIVAFKDITDMNTMNEWEAGFGIVKFGEYECECDEYSGRAYGFYIEGHCEYKRRSGELDRYKGIENALVLDKYEVIGNIYENPDLCKTSTDKGGQ